MKLSSAVTIGVMTSSLILAGLLQAQTDASGISPVPPTSEPSSPVATAPSSQPDKATMVVVLGVLIPKDQKETLIALKESRSYSRKDTAIFVRTANGFDIFELRDNKRGDTGMKIKIDSKNSNVLTLVGSGREEHATCDVTDIVKALKPFDKNPTQKFKFGGAEFSVEAKGKELRVSVLGCNECDGVFFIRPSDADSSATRPSTSPASHPATAPSGEDARKIGKEFIADLAKADTDALGKHYAQGVAVLAGSELLKPEWGLDPDGDRSTALAVSRDDLMKAYGRLMATSGTKWRKIFTGLADESISLEFADGNKPPAIQNGDLLLTVKIGSDSLLYVFRKQASGKWEVVAERTDY